MVDFASVQIVPVVEPLPESRNAVENMEFRIKCNATGKPPPKYIWTKDSDFQDLSRADRFQVNDQTGLLIITNVDPQDHSSYTCRAVNDAGESESRMQLNVLTRPRIWEFLNTTTAIGREASLVCRATGRPPPEITFRRWGSQEEMVPGNQPSDDRLVLHQEFNEFEGRSNGTLFISKAVRADDGLYECVARNPGDSAYKIGHITVQYPPNFDHLKHLPPTFSWAEQVVNLTCFAQAVPNATIEWRWRDRRISELYDPNLKVFPMEGPISVLQVKPIHNGEYFSAYKCIATNEHGQAEHIMELKLATIPFALQNGQARVTKVTATAVTFEIISPETEFGLPILAFHCQFKERHTLDWTYAANRTWSPDSPFIVEGLRPQQAYDFRFATRNIVGVSQWGSYVSQSTPRRSEPAEPKTLHTPENPDDDEGEAVVLSPYADHFELRWNIPNDNGEPIDKYQIRYCPVSFDGNKI